MSDKQQPTEPNFVAIAGETPPTEPPPSGRASRKRKGKGLPDAPSQRVDNKASQGSGYNRPLAAKRPTPDTQQPHCIGQSLRYSKAGPSDEKWTGSTGPPSAWLLHLERITFLKVAISRVTRMVRSEALIQPYACYELGMVEVLWEQSEDLQQTYLDLKESVQQSMPSLLPCPWRCHLESINSLAITISGVARGFRSATSQLLLDVDMEPLLKRSEDLQQSYFELKRCVQQPVPSRGGQHSELNTTLNSLARFGGLD